MAWACICALIKHANWTVHLCDFKGFGRRVCLYYPATYNNNILKEQSPHLISTVNGKEEEEEASKLFNQIQLFRQECSASIAFFFIVAANYSYGIYIFSLTDIVV